MADFVPKFQIYNQANDTLIYHMENIINTNWPQEQGSSVKITNLRSTGAIFIPGGDKPYELFFRGILIADNYTALTTKIFALKNTIVLNTKYTLRCDKTVSTYDQINVIREVAIELDPGKKINIQYFTVRLTAQVW